LGKAYFFFAAALLPAAAHRENIVVEVLFCEIRKNNYIIINVKFIILFVADDRIVYSLYNLF
jgi:hypothetical protein